MDKGAHFYRCDFQLHTPRDQRWSGTHYVSDEDRSEYAARFIQACREKGALLEKTGLSRRDAPCSVFG